MYSVFYFVHFAVDVVLYYNTGTLSIANTRAIVCLPTLQKELMGHSFALTIAIHAYNMVCNKHCRNYMNIHGGNIWTSRNVTWAASTGTQYTRIHQMYITTHERNTGKCTSTSQSTLTEHVTVHFYRARHNAPS